MIIRYETFPSADSLDFLRRGIAIEAKVKKNQNESRNFSFFLYDEQGRVQGGVKATLYYGVLYFDLMYVEPSMRSKGYGKQLMMHAEEYGRQQECKKGVLTTMDWEGQAFYQKLGYQIDFIQDGYANDSKMIYMSKSLG